MPAPEAETAQISPQNESRVGSPATGLPACPLRHGPVIRVPLLWSGPPGYKDMICLTRETILTPSSSASVSPSVPPSASGPWAFL